MDTNNPQYKSVEDADAPIDDFGTAESKSDKADIEKEFNKSLEGSNFMETSI